MKITVIGTGAIGSLFGGFMTKAGYDVVLVEKNEALARLLNEKGLKIDGISGDIHVNVSATSDSSSIGVTDLAFLCVKAYDTQSAINEHIALVGERTTVVTLQNGLGNVEFIAEAVGPERVIGGTTSQGGYIVEPGHLRHAGNGPTHIGEIDGSQSPRIRMIQEILAGSGFPTEISPNVDELIWTKLLINVGINALTALMRVNNGLTSAVEPLRAVQREAVEEALLVAEAAGVKLDKASLHEKVVKVAEVTAGNVSSMLGDSRKKQRTEIGFINGAICRLGAKHSVPTPVNRTLTLLIEGMEQSYDRVVSQ